MEGGGLITSVLLNMGNALVKYPMLPASAHEDHCLVVSPVMGTTEGHVLQMGTTEGHVL